MPGYKISIHKSKALFYIGSKLNEKYIKEKILFPKTTKIKFLKRYLSKKMKDLDSKSVKTLKKEIEEYTQR